MKIKTAEATGLQLDWGLAKALELKPSIGRNSLGAFVQYKKAGCDFFRAVKPTDPAVCMGLIEQYKVATRFYAVDGFWVATIYDHDPKDSISKTLAESVARCVIAMQLGDEFECPDELGVQS